MEAAPIFFSLGNIAMIVMNLVIFVALAEYRKYFAPFFWIGVFLLCGIVVLPRYSSYSHAWLPMTIFALIVFLEVLILIFPLVCFLKVKVQKENRFLTTVIFLGLMLNSVCAIPCFIFFVVSFIAITSEIRLQHEGF